MSPRAACRLETLGFEEVYDYVPGKVDWLARGLPTEGEKAGEPRAGSAARDDVVRCGPQEVVEEVRHRVQRSPYGFALVVAGGEIVLGRLGSAALEGEPRATAEAAMDPGPSTVRMDMPLVDLDDRLDRRGLTTAVVTTPDGRLTGIVRRSDLTEQLEAASEPQAPGSDGGA